MTKQGDDKKKSMKIGLLSPSIFSSPGLFPDKIFAPRELLTDLSNGLVDRGHEITVFGPPDIETRAKVVGIPTEHIADPLPYFKFRGESAPHQRALEAEFAKHRFELECVTRAFGTLRRGEIDLLHVYHDSSLFISHYVQDQMGENLPVVYTLHDPLPPQDTFEFHEFTRFAGHNFVSISNSFRHSEIPIHFIETVYHGIDVSRYPFGDTPGDAFLFLGRLVPEKGLHNALAACISQGTKLTVSTNIPDVGDESPYVAGLRNDLTNSLVSILPVVDKARRLELYRNAKALLFPIEWEEPFGVVLIEAMACGTPVIAYNRGSVAEIVRDGVTGYIIDPDDTDRPGKGTWTIKSKGVAGLQEAMGLLQNIHREDCRKHTEDNFSAEKMTENYELLYKKILGK